MNRCSGINDTGVWMRKPEDIARPACSSRLRRIEAYITGQTIVVGEAFPPCPKARDDPSVSIHQGERQWTMNRFTGAPLPAIKGKHSPLFYDKPLHLVRGKGVWLFDASGKRCRMPHTNSTFPWWATARPQVLEARNPTSVHA